MFGLSLEIIGKCGVSLGIERQPIPRSLEAHTLVGNLTHKQPKTQGINVPREAQRASRITHSSGQYCTPHPTPHSRVGWAGSPEGSTCVLGLKDGEHAIG